MNNEKKRIVIGNDHAAVELKNSIMKHLQEKGFEVINVGTDSDLSVDYPDFAKAVCEKVISKEADAGIAVCGTGVGISIACNKIKGIRACCCSEPYSSRMSRLHNDANVLCFGARVVGTELAAMITDTFLETDFEGGRHQKRVDKIVALENTDR